MDELEAQYADLTEDARLERTFSSRLEFHLTTDALGSYLERGARVCELGAATGRYALHYARLGHPVTAVEVVAEQAAALDRRARRAGLAVRVVHADARHLPEVGDGGHEATLVLGPLYHLRDEDDRRAVLREARRVTASGGVVAVAYINRFFMAGYYAQRRPALLETPVMEELLAQGTVSDARADGFSRVAYFGSPEEMEALVASEGMEVVDHLATDGIGRLFVEGLEALTPEQQQTWAGVQRRMCRERTLLGAGNHGLLIARTP